MQDVKCLLTVPTGGETSENLTISAPSSNGVPAQMIVRQVAGRHNHVVCMPLRRHCKRGLLHESDLTLSKRHSSRCRLCTRTGRAHLFSTLDKLRLAILDCQHVAIDGGLQKTVPQCWKLSDMQACTPFTAMSSNQSAFI